ncbi:sulfite exporter TauE/SafE family protein [Arhodomonas sp. AD133]|uniref:sulfite exporter TauE/SafE family protein n=1 Tax=Arhodomonas sp. AD133 TaxID=3415009 RepID=UPI003EBE3DA1
MSLELVTAAFLSGLFGSAHCVGMCGGISAALGMGAGGNASAMRLAGYASLYNLGRIGSYIGAGAVAGAVGTWLGIGFDVADWATALRMVAGAVIIAIGLQLGFGWRLLAPVERAGFRVWRHLAPLARSLMTARNPARALALGALWGWLPCGLVYGMLLMASVSGGAPGGMVVMAAFGAGTLPAMIATGAVGGHLRRLTARPGLRRAAGGMMVALGVWTVALPSLLIRLDLQGLAALCLP